MRDVTPSRERNDTPAPDQIRRNAVWMRALGEAWQAGVVVLGADGSPDFATRRACEMLGVDDSGALRARWPTVAAPLIERLPDATSDADCPLPVTLDVATGSGRQLLHCEVYAISEEDCTGHLLLLSSADRVVKVERSLRQSARYRGLMSLYRELAHDLKESLNAIALNLEVLGTSTPADQQVSMQVVRNEVARLDRTLMTLLDRNVLDDSPRRRVDVSELVTSVAELLRGRARAQHVALDLRLPGEPLEVDGWPDQIHAAVLNLAVNALDAMPAGGTLQLATGGDGVAVEIRVCDQGSGIRPEDRGRIWRLYATTKEQGSGVGLHVVRTVARAHGGRADLLPEAPQGFTTVFRLLLPRAGTRVLEP